MIVKPRAIFFLSFAALVSQVRFTSLLFRSYEMDDQKIGISLGVGLVAGAMMVPIWTRQADMKGSLIILKIIMIGHMAATLLYTFTPLVVEENRVWFTMFGRILAMGFMQALSPVADAYALRRLAGVRALYGRERAWGSFSWGLSAVILGALMNSMDWSLAYQLFTVLLTALTMVCLHLAPSDLTEVSEDAYVKPSKVEQTFVIDDEEDKEMQPMTPQEKGTIKQDPRVQRADDGDDADETTKLKEKPKSGMTIFLRNAELNTVVFLVVMLCLEMGQSLTESLEFLFIIEELKSSPLLCGVSVAVAVILEVPLLFMSEPLLRRIGILSLMLFGIFVFCVKITAFTFLNSDNPWLILSVEPLGGIYVALLKMSSVSFMSQAAPKGQEAVAMGTMNVFRCMGQVFGTVIGSYVLQNFGSTVLYRSFGILVTAAGFVLIWIFQRRRRAALAAAEASTAALPGAANGLSEGRIRPSTSISLVEKASLGLEIPASERKASISLPAASPLPGDGKTLKRQETDDVIKSEVALLELHKG